MTPHTIAPGFQAFTAEHYCTVAGCACMMATAAGAGVCLHRIHGPKAERRFRRTLGWAAIGVFVFSVIWNVLPQNLDWEVSLPLQYCDLGLLVAGGALLTNARWLRGLLYFWGTVFTVQAFATPVLDSGPDTVTFWLFWAAHTAITGSCVYDLVAGGFRPVFSDAMRSYLISFGYGFVLLVLDNLTGWDYGYVGPGKPGAKTLLDALGGYPTRVMWMALLAAAGFVIAWLPWAMARWKKN